MAKSNKDTGLPVKTTDLIKELDKLFPTYNPTPSDNIQNIMFKAGQRSVIEFLKSRNNDELTTEVFK